MSNHFGKSFYFKLHWNRDEEIRCKTHLISPVKAPPLRTQQFWAATWKSDRNKLLTRGRNTNGGLTTTSARQRRNQIDLNHLPKVETNTEIQRKLKQNSPTTSSEGTSDSFNVLTIFFTSSPVPFCKKKSNQENLNPISYYNENIIRFKHSYTHTYIYATTYMPKNFKISNKWLNQFWDRNIMDRSVSAHWKEQNTIELNRKEYTMTTNNQINIRISSCRRRRISCPWFLCSLM